ncbi:MAG: TetR/AcrR family transcriptional regulator [Spirochaetes bacterium]|nr:TetR/AcrR family transcriptional regulator [Spirochaetota bacterium]
MADKDLKHEVKKEEIINTAFIEWGKTNYKNTSLSLLSLKLKITKPALYRYFKDKNELIKEMKLYLINYMSKLALEFIEESIYLDAEKTLELYITKHFGYFCSNLYQFFFYVQFVAKDNFFQKPDIKILLEKEKKIFSNIIDNHNTWLKKEDAMFLIRQIFFTGIFLIIYNYFNKIASCKISSVKFNNEEIKSILELIINITKNGIMHKPFNFIDYDKIEVESIVNPEELPKREKLFDAIATVVAKEGIWEASIGKIAQEMGMSKSSIYFYFISKADMFINMVKTEITKKDEILNKKSMQYESFEEKIYSIIVSLASYYLNDLRILNVFDWLHYQGMQFMNFKKINKNKFIIPEFINNLLNTNKILNKFNFDNYFIYTFMNMQVVKELFLSKTMNFEIKIKDMRNIFKYFINGIIKGDIYE